MAKNIEMQYYNGSSYELLYPKTLSTLVIMSDSTTLENTIKSLKTSVSNGKSSIASAITDKGISTSATADFSTMASNIRNISTLSSDTSDATATAGKILKGYTAYAKGSKITGTHSCPTLASMTSDATATASDIASGKTAYVNGSKITGTMSLGADHGTFTQSEFDYRVTLPTTKKNILITIVGKGSSGTTVKPSTSYSFLMTFAYVDGLYRAITYDGDIPEFVCNDFGSHEPSISVGDSNTTINMGNFRTNEFASKISATGENYKCSYYWFAWD